MKLLESYPWHGNARELENLIERLVVSSDSSMISLNDQPLFDYLGEGNHTEGGTDNNEIISLKKARDIFENQLINRAIKKYGSTRKAAQALGVNHSTVIRKAKKHNENKP